MKIERIHAREIIDSRANPTVEVEVHLTDGSVGRAAVPSGASTGKHEAHELRDKDENRYLGKGVQKAVGNITTEINQELQGLEIDSQAHLDELLCDLDGTEHKERLGANAILGVSMAFAVAAANSLGMPLYKYISELYGDSPRLPRPMFNIMNGGKHANWSTDIQEFMVIPKQSESWAESMRIGAEIFLNLEKLLKENRLSTNVGNEGGFAPSLESNAEALDLVMEAIELAGYKPEEEVGLALDVAASEFYHESEVNERVAAVHYQLKTEDKLLQPQEWLQLLSEWVDTYPLISIEDPFGEDDWEFWNKFTQEMQNTDVEQVVGDDLLVTNVDRIQRAIDEQSCNALLVKLNQIGTLTETLTAMQLSAQAGWKNIVSHRSGETEDVFIAHLVVGTGAGQIKSGAPSRGERTAKFNELLRIEEALT